MSAEKIQFFTTPAAELFSQRALQRDPARSLQTPHFFDQVVGVVYDESLHGTETGTVFAFDTPAGWGKRLLAFAGRYLDNPLRHDAVPYSDYSVNCHQFASFMLSGTLYGIQPKSALTTPLEGADVPFGTHIALGQNDIDSGLRARHSSLSLGGQAPDKCLQLTADDGVLAIDSITALDAYYKSRHPTEPIAWHYAG